MRSFLCLALLVVVPLGVSCTGGTGGNGGNGGTGGNGDETPVEPDCGNGMLEEGEVCEGMPTPMGCNPNTCQVQQGWVCSPEPPSIDGETGDAFEPIPFESTCDQLDTCGDGEVDPGEDCDDGDSTVGDGCSNCTVDPLWTCMNEPGMASDCRQCGDGFLDAPFEECDDGEESNVTGMDTPGCEACMVQAGWTCFQGVENYSLCAPLCGDGMWFDSSVGGVNLGSAEGCDDGNLIPGDGCSGTCDVEPGCECSGPVEGMSTCMCGMGTDDTGGDSSGSSDSGGSTSTG